MSTKPYCLIGEDGTSDAYYSCIGKFSDMIIEKAEKSLGNVIKDFEEYMKKHNGYRPKYFNELVVEVLGAGIMWKVYSGLINQNNFVLRNTIARASKMRSTNNKLKPALDIIKGYLITFVYRFDFDNSRSTPTPEDIYKIIKWLEAFGEFEYEVKRMKQWHEYLSNAEGNISSIIEFADWFEIEAQRTLGKFTHDTDKFTEQNYRGYRFREDLVFCMRKPIEYHYNMAGAELLNRAYRSEFEGSNKKMILLPVCMRKRQTESCRAKHEPLGLVCACCEKDCMVNKITGLGQENGYEVYIIPHESTAFTGKEQSGIIGISCVTRLIEGGYMARKLGFSPQCVILDYCGCKKHWSKNGISTTLSIKELEKIIMFQGDCQGS